MMRRSASVCSYWLRLLVTTLSTPPLHHDLLVKDFHRINLPVSFISHLPSHPALQTRTSNTFPKEPFPTVFSNSKSSFVSFVLSFIGSRFTTNSSGFIPSEPFPFNC